MDLLPPLATAPATPALPQRARDGDIRSLTDGAHQIRAEVDELAKAIRTTPEAFDAKRLAVVRDHLDRMHGRARELQNTAISVLHPDSPYIAGLGDVPVFAMGGSWHELPSRASDGLHAAVTAIAGARTVLDGLIAKPTADGLAQLGSTLQRATAIGGAANLFFDLERMRFYDTPARKAVELLGQIDVDGDGIVTIAREHERESQMQDRFVPSRLHREFRTQLEGIDRLGNGDGIADRFEIESFFVRADSDHDGWLSAADLNAVQRLFPVLDTRTDDAPWRT